MSIVKIYKKHMPSFVFFCFCFGSKLLYETYKSAQEEANEMDEEDLPKVDSVIKILIAKVCQKCNVPSVIANSRLLQMFKTKIWRLNQALAKGNGLKKLFSQWTNGKYLRFITMNLTV